MFYQLELASELWWLSTLEYCATFRSNELDQRITAQTDLKNMVWSLNNNSLTVNLGERHELPAGALPVGYGWSTDWL